MNKPSLHIVDVFTTIRGKGNAAGIIYNPPCPIVPEDYQDLASSEKLSEIVLILPGEKAGADYRFRFFAPKEEVALCGHGTIGALAYIYRKETSLKKANLTIETQAGVIQGGIAGPYLYYMNQQLPEFDPTPIDAAKVARILGITEVDFINQPTPLPLQMVSTGRSKLMVPIKNLALLHSIKPDFAEMEVFCHEIDTNGLHLFTFETVSSKIGVHTRHFAPTAGVAEDPVTGVANGALGAYLVKHGIFDTGLLTKIFVEQGHIMQKDGEMIVEIRKDHTGNISGVRICGHAVFRENTETDWLKSKKLGYPNLKNLDNE